MLTVLLVVPALSSQLKILNTPNSNREDTLRPAPCALICSGVARHDETGWSAWRRGIGFAFKYNYMTDCDFVTAPVVTATIRGPFISMRCPSIIVNDIDINWFSVQTVEDATGGQMIRRKCDVYWIATGYNC